MKFGLLRKRNYEKVFCEPVTYYLQITFLDNMIVFESCHCPIWMVESIFFRKQLKICFSRNISRGLWLYLPLEQKCYNEIDIWEKVFKNGLSKFCGRQPLKSLLSLLCPIVSAKTSIKDVWQIPKYHSNKCPYSEFFWSVFSFI